MPDSIAVATQDLAASVRGQIQDALDCLRSADLAAADQVVRRDQAVNQARYAIENSVTTELTATSEVGQVRYLIAVLAVVNDLERIGDHAEGIAKIALMRGVGLPDSVPQSLNDLGRQVLDMFERGVATFADRDAGAARLVSGEDDAIDELYDSVCAEILARMSQDPESITNNTYLLWVIHNLERIADRVTNICERTVYLTTGTVEELNVSDY